MRILLVEDNPRLATSLRNGLRAQGYGVDSCSSGFEAEEKGSTEPYDLVVLDLMLPDRDGIETCRNLRRLGVSAPILILTALSDLKNKVAGLDAGADDYMTKPFEFEELLARIRALLRRGQASESSRLSYDELELDLIRRTARRQGRLVKLSSREFSILEFLMRNPERVLDRSTIAQKVWDMNFEPSSNVIDVYISSLRKKLDRDFGRPLFHTVVGMGYLFGRREEEARRS